MKLNLSCFASMIQMDALRSGNRSIQSRYGKILVVTIAALMVSSFAVIHRPTKLNKVLVVLSSMLFTVATIATMLFIAATRSKKEDEMSSAEMVVGYDSQKPIFESSSELKAADEDSVVDQYLNDDRPSNEVMRTISQNPQLVRRLINADANLNKLSADGIGIVAHDMDFEAFCTLVDRGYNLRFTAGLSPDGFIRFSGFEEIVASTDSRYLRYVLDKRLVKVEHFSANEQMRLWTYVGNLEAIRLLVDYGFDINAKHVRNGYTAVQNLIHFPDDIATCIAGRSRLSAPNRADALMKIGGAQWPTGAEMSMLDRMLRDQSQ